jgi:HEAT repeat protein
MIYTGEFGQTIMRNLGQMFSEIREKNVMIDCNNLEREKIARSNDVLQTTIDSLIANLGSNDGFVRQKARIALIRMGETAVPSLIKALGNRTEPTHWEAAKALSLISDPRSVQALVQALEDNEFGVRWLAAEGLITVGYCSLAPLLQALIDRPQSIRLREGAHHVLHDLVSRHLINQASSERVKPVLATLYDIEPAVEVPLAAHKALDALKVENATPETEEGQDHVKTKSISR